MSLPPDPPPTPSSPLSPGLSVQLYTVREALAEDLTGTLRRLADLGLTQVEPFAFTTFPGLAHGLADAGLSAPTTHMHLVGEDPDALDRLFAAAADLGVGTVVEPHVPAERWSSEEHVAGVAADLAAAARVAAGHGVRVGYHNHAHELESVLDGTTALEVLARHLERTGSDVVLEVDTYWVAVGGQDPVALLGRLGDRVAALHVKDGPATTETKDQVAVGSGSLPVREIIGAAPHALRVVELDDSRGDRFEAVAGSVRWLTEQGLA